MQLSMLKTPEIGEVPSSIKVIENWGHVDVVDSSGGAMVSGDHVHLEGPRDSFVEWLKPFDGIWITKPGTSPMEQMFTVVHVK